MTPKKKGRFGIAIYLSHGLDWELWGFSMIFCMTLIKTRISTVIYSTGSWTDESSSTYCFEKRREWVSDCTWGNS
jgi:hypothetical protein